MDFKGSEQIVVDQLKLFQVPPTESAVVRSEWVEYRPLGVVTENSPVDFQITPQENQYLDLKRSLLKIRFRVVQADGQLVDPLDRVAIRNNIVNLFWSQDDIYLNQVLVSPASNNYAYKSYLDVLMNENSENNKRLEAWGYYKDTGGSFDEQNVLTGNNEGLTTRYALVSGSKVATVVGPLQSDLCSCNKWIMPGVDVLIRLWQTNQKFRIMIPDGVIYACKIVFDDIVFLANKITVKPEITQAHNQILKTVNAKYPFQRTRLHTYHIPQGSTFFRQDQLFQNERPDKILIGIVESVAFHGSEKLNPFNFKNQDVTNIDYTIDDKSFNGRRLEMNFGEYNAVEAFYNLTSHQGKDNGLINGPNITYSDFDEGYALYLFDEYGGLMSPMRPKNTDIRSGNSKLIINFGTPLPQDCAVMVYGIFNDMFEIDQHKKIII